MVSFAAVLRIVAQRSLGNRRLLATVVLGVVFSAALASAVAIYSDAIRDLGLSYALRNQPITQLDIQVSSSSHPARRADYEARQDRTLRLLRGYAGDVTRETVRHGYSATFFLTPPDQPVPQDQNRPRAFFQFFERLPDHTRVTEGKRPGPATRPPAGQRPEIEVLLGKETAERLGVQVGQSFDMHPFWKPEVRPVRITVAGLVEPNDPNEEYWLGRTDRFSVTSTSWPTYPFFTDAATMIEVLAGYLPDMDASYQTFAYVDIDRINARNARQVEANLRAMTSRLREDIARTSVDTKLPDTIGNYRQKLFFTRLPLFALMLQIIGIVLYYLVMVSTMLVERQAGEIALLRSRGASTLQIMTVYAIEGGVIAAIGLVAGPWLAAGVITLLGPTPPFRELSAGELLTVRVSWEAFNLALLGSMMALAALLWPAYRATRLSIVHYKQGMGRPAQQPAFLRYYLDLFLIAVAAFLFYELRQRGSLVTEKLFGDLSADPLLLLTPTLFMLMVALVFLRLFPLALRLVTWATSGMAGAAIPLGLRRMVRAPVHYSRLILLLILATAVGMFAAGFRATLDRSYEDRVAYAAGADLQVTGIRQQGLPPDRLASAVTASTGGQGTPLWRTFGSYTISQFNFTDVTVLGVRPSEFDKFSFWRNDFSGGSLNELLRPLREEAEPAPKGPALPQDARLIGVWISTPLPFNLATYGMRLVDDAGSTWDYRLLGPDQSRFRQGEWQFYYAEVSRPGLGRVPDNQGPAAGSVRLHSFFVRMGQINQEQERANIYFDDVQVTSAAAPPADWFTTGFTDGTVIEGFESLDIYEAMTSQAPRGVQSALNRTEGRVHGGRYAAQLAVPRPRGGQTVHGLRTRDDGGPLPVVVSETFLKQARKKVGDTIQVSVNRTDVQAKIAGTFKLFPTYIPNENDDHLMITDLDRMLAKANRASGGAEPGFANEVWVRGATRNPTVADLRARNVSADKVVSLEGLRAEQQRDPLVAASWEGILFISFAAVLLLTALGFIVYSYLSAQTRALEFAILRTMGFSGRQIAALVSFEQAFVILAGAVAGTVLGLPLGRLMIGYMGVTETGDKVIPPLVSQVSWRTVAIADGVLAAIFLVTIAALVLLYSRLAVHRALRMGEL